MVVHLHLVGRGNKRESRTNDVAIGIILQFWVCSPLGSHLICRPVQYPGEVQWGDGLPLDQELDHLPT